MPDSYPYPIKAAFFYLTFVIPPSMTVSLLFPIFDSPYTFRSDLYLCYEDSLVTFFELIVGISMSAEISFALMPLKGTTTFYSNEFSFMRSSN